LAEGCVLREQPGAVWHIQLDAEVLMPQIVSPIVGGLEGDTTTVCQARNEPEGSILSVQAREDFCDLSKVITMPNVVGRIIVRLE
jgi:hypothetical protein